MKLRLLTATLAICALSAPAFAQNQAPAEFTISESGWSGGASAVPGTDQFSHCGVEKQQSEGEHFVILMNAEGRMALGINRADWTLEDGVEGPGQVTIDDKVALPVTATVGSEKLLIFPIGGDPSVISAIQQGNAVALTSALASATYPLSGTFKAVEALKACINRAIQMAQAAAAAQAPQAVEPSRMDTGTVAQLMDAAGITGIALASPEELDPSQIPVEQAWQIQNVRGALHQAPREQAIEIGLFTDSFVSRFEEVCPGTFERTRDEPEIIRDIYAITSGTFGCKTEEGETHAEIIVVLDDHFYSAFVHESSIDQKENVAAINARLKETFRAMISGAPQQ